MAEQIKCPLCKRRAFDPLSCAFGETELEMKSPHCRMFVRIKVKKGED